MDDTAVVYVVDDDPSVRNAVRMLLEVAGFRVVTCESAEKFLDSDLGNISGCLVLDVRMSGLSGLDLQRSLASRNVELPIAQNLYGIACHPVKWKITEQLLGIRGYRFVIRRFQEKLSRVLGRFIKSFVVGAILHVADAKPTPCAGNDPARLV